jgi:hypothetical protein
VSKVGERFAVMRESRVAADSVATMATIMTRGDPDADGERGDPEGQHEWVHSRGLFAPGGKSRPERADQGANDGVIELAAVHAQSFEEGEAVQGCEQG